MPTDSDTSSIAVEIKDFQDAEINYLDIKLKMIEAKKLPFDSDEFVT